MNSDFFYLILLAHMVGDFMLQTDRIAMLKATTIRGLFIHCGIVFAAQAIALSIFGIKGIAAAIVSGIVHLVIDYSKNLINKHLSRFQLGTFILDQLIHVTFLLLITYIFAPATWTATMYSVYSRILSGIIAVIYVSTVCVKILIRDIDKKLLSQPFFLKNERKYDAVFCSILSLIAVFTGYYSLLFIPSLFVLYYKIQRSHYYYTLSSSIQKYLVLALTAVMFQVVCKSDLLKVLAYQY